MKDIVAQVLNRMRPYVERDCSALEAFFVDEDFGIVEILLRRRPETTEEAIDAVRYSVEQMILRQVPGVRQVEFLAESPPPPGVPPQPTGQPGPAELAKLRSGAALALSILDDLETLLRADAAARALRRPHGSWRFLNGPYRNWLDAALSSRQALPPASAGAEELLPPLREIYFNLERAARAFARLVEVERAAWDGELDARPDEARPRSLRRAAELDLHQALFILEELRPRLGDRTLEGFLAGDGAPEEDAAPTVRLLDRIFKDALQQHIRDVYLDLQSVSAVLQYRVGRRLERVLSFPPRLYAPLVAKIKHLASLDVADKRRRQEGLICFTASSGYRGLTVQVQTIPDQLAERVRFRLHLPAGRAEARA